MADIWMVRYLRLVRESTDSWLTAVLPEDMPFEEGLRFAKQHMPGWLVVSGCLRDPDSDSLSLGEKNE